jgi:anti-anti-sigma factor
MAMELLTSCAVHHTDRSTRLVLVGEIDASNVRVVSALFEKTIRSGGDMEVDLSGVTFLDSTMLNLLANTSERMADSGRGFQVVGASFYVKRVLPIAGLRHLME